MERVFIIDAARLPIGKNGGVFANVKPEKFGGYLLEKLLSRNKISHNSIDEVVVGNTIGGGGNIARRIALSAGLPVEIPAVTVDRQCASGLESIIIATAKIKSGAADFIVCGGVESTSLAPWLIERPANLYKQIPKILERAPLSVPPYGDPDMGNTCEALAQRLGIDRRAQDNYAYQSQKKYQKAREKGLFAEEIISYGTITQDESPRESTTLEKLSLLTAAFQEEGSLTAGNSCPLNDGAAFLLVASESFCKTNQVIPLFEILGGLSVGTIPQNFCLGPVYATEKLLKKLSLTLTQIDKIELNESFAAQALACIELGKWPVERINSSGGALAFGHPFGATGAILVRRLMTELQCAKDSKIGLVSMCVGGGQGTALVVQKAAIV